jgi:A/G-specific adenine glycosylase
VSCWASDGIRNPLPSLELQLLATIARALATYLECFHRMSPHFASRSRTRDSFRDHLLVWYYGNRRDLPWRSTRDAYCIWLSEIMLQQTRVAAVLDHYRRFLERFPNVQALARAREQSVLAAWSGLGYYRRARNLHACAKLVVSKLGGKFPTTAAELEELPGIGRYTAAAIASIAFDRPNAVVDGNVERVLQRLTGNPKLAQRDAWDLANELLSPDRPGDFNQAMMELGATVCLPGEPKCLACPLMKYCVTRGAHPRDAREERIVRELALGWLQDERSVWLVQRPIFAGLMPAMWELPEVQPNGDPPLARFKHSILDTDYRVSVFPMAAQPESGRWISHSRLPKTALTGLARKVLRHFRML